MYSSKNGVIILEKGTYLEAAGLNMSFGKRKHFTKCFIYTYKCPVTLHNDNDNL
jgi:hypothetical protein